MAERKQFTTGNVVTEVLNDWLDRHPDLNLVEIAERIGVEKSKHCFMSQVRSGRSKLPVSKIMPLAKLMEEDPKPLVVAVLDTYYPDLKQAMAEANMLNASDTDDLVNLRKMDVPQKEAV